MDWSLPPGTDTFPLHRAKIEAACRWGAARDELVGMAISGSFALGIADDYSDVDLKLVTTDEGHDSIVGAQNDLIRACGTAIARFPADHTGLPELTIVLYDDLVHVDLHPIRLSELATKNAGMPATVLWERDGAVSRALAASHAQPPTIDLEWIERRIWTWFWYLQSKVLRGEIYEVLDGLAWLRGEVLYPLLGAVRQRPVAGARRIEPLLDDAAPGFAATAPRVDRAEVMDALRATAELYRRLADPLLRARGIPEATAARVAVGDALTEGLDWRPGKSRIS
jgi:hypothetical protein